MKLSTDFDETFFIIRASDTKTIGIVKVSDLVNIIQSNSAEISKRSLIIDFSKIEHIDSSVIGWLFQLNKNSLSSKNYRIRLVTSQTLKKNLKIVKAEVYLVIIDSIEEAKTSINNDSQK
ncbi:MAG: STAS domain-containing protein [Leptospiraceae bacterium]|nr:STAS domain-containing protein [Leptospiraceae bacterium]